MTAVAQVKMSVQPRTSVSVRRRRLAFVLALVCLVVAAAAVLAGRASAGGVESGPEANYTVVEVRSGETLSQIAQREMPQEVNAEAVVEIQVANNLGSMHVAPGEKLLIPRHA